MPPSAPWYAEGLCFACTGCGRCCRGPGGYVWLDDGEIAGFAAALGLPLDRFARQYLRSTSEGLALVDGFGGDCIFHDRGTNRCRFYAQRPAQCRTWPWWPENLRSRDAWEREARRCPGMNRGPRWSRERIDQECARSARGA